MNSRVSSGLALRIVLKLLGRLPFRTEVGHFNAIVAGLVNIVPTLVAMSQLSAFQAFRSPGGGSSSVERFFTFCPCRVAFRRVVRSSAWYGSSAWQELSCL